MDYVDTYSSYETQY